MKKRLAYYLVFASLIAFLFITNAVVEAQRRARFQNLVSRHIGESTAYYDQNHAVIATFQLVPTSPIATVGGEPQYQLLVKVRPLTEQDPEYDPVLTDEIRTPFLGWLTVNGRPVPLTPAQSPGHLFAVLPEDWWEGLTDFSLVVRDESDDDILTVAANDLFVF